MENLPSPAVYDDNFPRILSSNHLTHGRKRARSSASSEASSSKRAMSEDPSFCSATETPLSSALPSTPTATDDIDAYMQRQGEKNVPVIFGSSLPNSVQQSTCLEWTKKSGLEFPRADIDNLAQAGNEMVTKLPPAERYQRIKDLQGTSRAAGQTWYVISRSWYRRWKKACTGEEDKEGVVLESQLGPVENSSFFKQNGRFDATQGMIEWTDVEFVPEKAWRLLVDWYGKPQHVIARQVIARGRNNEPILELRPPEFQVLRLVPDAETGTFDAVPKYVAVSSQIKLSDLYLSLLDTLDIPSDHEFRVWKLDVFDEAFSSYPKAKLLADGAQLMPRKDDMNSMSKAVEESDLQSGDVLVIESFENNSWLVDASLVSSSDSGVSSTKDQSASTVFSSGSDFFSKLSPNKFKSATTSTSTIKPYAPILTPSSSSLGKSRADKISAAPGTIGLVNMGNTCFMNSALQCLAHTRELVEYFLTGVYKEELNPDNPLGMGGAVAEAFGELLHRIWLPQSSSAYAPREFKARLQRFELQSSGYQQHDSQELVAFLLDGLHEDLNRILEKPSVVKPEWEGGGNKELLSLAKESWVGYMKRNDSVIVDLFQGQYRSILACPVCQKVSITFDPFMYLTLPIPVSKKWSHKIYYIPWDTSKPHIKAPLEVNRNASFREVRNLLARWMWTEPDNLLTMEVFNNRFYKDLDDTILVSEMSETDVIVCYELPCHAQQSRTWRPDGDSTKNPLIIPVRLCKELPPSKTSFQRLSDGFAYPFVIVLDNDQIRDRNRVYAAVIERLERWTKNSRDLYQWVADEYMEMVPSTTTVVEIKRKGETSMVQDDFAPEEVDIVDGEPLDLESEGTGFTSNDEFLRRLGPKPELFEMHVQSGHDRLVASNSWTPHAQKWENWETREKASGPNPPLLYQGDALYCEWNENVREYFFGGVSGYEASCWGESHWEEFIHVEYEESQAAALTRKNRNITLHDCLEEFTREEELGKDDLWYCPQCKKHQQAMKRFGLWTVPDILVVHLKRFSSSRILRDKIDAFVDFPITDLNLEEFCGERESVKRLAEEGYDTELLGLPDTNEPLVYDLYAVDEHLGGLGGGHYRAYAKHHGTDMWYHFDDSFVSPVKATDAVNANAYLLFYKRRTNRPIGGKTFEKIEAARQQRVAVVDNEEPILGTHLPTPPDEVNYLNKGLGQSTTLTVYGTGRDSMDQWRGLSPGPSTGLSPSSPALDEIDFSSDNENNLPAFLDPQFARLGSPGIDIDRTDALGLATHRFDFPDPASLMTSPASSNVAELGDIGDLGDVDFPHNTTPETGDNWLSDDERRTTGLDASKVQNALLDIDM